jgi:hypothetical protein
MYQAAFRVLTGRLLEFMGDGAGKEFICQEQKLTSGVRSSDGFQRKDRLNVFG